MAGLIAVITAATIAIVTLPLAGDTVRLGGMQDVGGRFAGSRAGWLLRWTRLSGGAKTNSWVEDAC